MYDVTKIQSFEHLERWKAEFLAQVQLRFWMPEYQRCSLVGRSLTAFAVCNASAFLLWSHVLNWSHLQAAPDDPSTFPFVLLGNKCDEPSDKRMVSDREARGWCDGQNKIPYLETSAKNDTNVPEAFTTIVNLALSCKSEEPPVAARNLDFTEGARPQPKSSCC